MLRAIFAAMLVAAGLSTYSAALAQARDWAFVQSVGGLAIDAPVQKNGSWLLPIRCNVSGLETVTVRPSTLNSGLGCSVSARVEGQSILLTVATRLDSSAACPPVNLGPLAKGRYTVFYSGAPNERVRLQEIEIAL